MEEKEWKEEEEEEEIRMKQTLIIDELQIQMSKMQIQLLEERRNYLSLVGDCQGLKVSFTLGEVKLCWCGWLIQL